MLVVAFNGVGRSVLKSATVRSVSCNDCHMNYSSLIMV